MFPSTSDKVIRWQARAAFDRLAFHRDLSYNHRYFHSIGGDMVAISPHAPTG